MELVCIVPNRGFGESARRKSLNRTIGSVNYLSTVVWALFGYRISRVSEDAEDGAVFNYVPWLHSRMHLTGMLAVY